MLARSFLFWKKEVSVAALIPVPYGRKRLHSVVVKSVLNDIFFQHRCHVYKLK